MGTSERRGEERRRHELGFGFVMFGLAASLTTAVWFTGAPGALDELACAHLTSFLEICFSSFLLFLYSFFYL
jgi:hypothetical protein